jgi:cytochrome c oxidase subunit IV
LALLDDVLAMPVTLGGQALLASRSLGGGWHSRQNVNLFLRRPLAFDLGSVMEHTEVPGHIIPYRTFVRVWLILLLLTAVLVITSRVWHETLSVWAMLILTPVKAGLVFFYFMHLKFEKPYLRALVFLTLGLLVLVMGILFFDILNR